MLQPFADQIWIAGDRPARAAAPDHRARMAVIRLPGRALFVWSPIALTPTLRESIDALGTVRHIVAPNSLRHLFLQDWAAAYPAAQVHGAPKLRQRRPDIAFHHDLDETPAPDWAGVIEQVVVGGNLITAEVVFFHWPSKTTLFTDLIQQFPPDSFRGWRRILAGLDLMTEDRPTVPRKYRLAFVNRTSARNALRRIRSWPTENLLMAHGTPVEQDGQAAVEHAFRWLGR